MLSDDEAAEWQALLLRAAIVKQLLSTITDLYVQGLSVRETLTTNSQARSVGRDSSLVRFANASQRTSNHCRNYQT